MGRPGRELRQYLSKGRPVAIDGRLEWSQWEAQDGAKREAVEVIADTVQFLGSRGDNEGGGRAAASSRPPSSSPTRCPPSAAAPRRPTTTSPSKRGTSLASKPKRRTGPQRGAAAGRVHTRKPCYFCKEKVEEIDYKNYNQLRRYMSEKGKIRSRRISGACRRHQRQVAVAIKRAREMALLPYAVN